MEQKEQKEDNFFDILKRLDEKRANEYRGLFEAIENRKEDYDRIYHIQFEEYKVYNKWSGKKKKGIEPHEYRKMLDQELLAHGHALEADMKEERKAKAEEKEHMDKVYGRTNEPEKETETDERRAAFRKEWEEMGQGFSADKDQEKEPEPDPDEKETDPRRLAFRKEWEDMERQNDRGKTWT